MEHEYLFTKSLHEKMKEKIKGRIFCKVINDKLVIDIDTKEGINYGTIIDDFSRKCQLGELDHDTIIADVVKEYRKIVLSTFFY